jgi:hypothetical protein
MHKVSAKDVCQNKSNPLNTKCFIERNTHFIDGITALSAEAHVANGLTKQ